jgi:serine protease Do
MHKQLLCSIAILLLLASSTLLAQERVVDGLFRGAIEKTNPRMVKIFGATIGNIDGYGTGLLVSDNGQILTADGVYLSGASIRVTLNDGSTYSARMIRTDPNLRLALLQIDARTPEYFQLTDQRIGQQGDWVLAISNAFKVAERIEPLSVNLGLISLRTQIEARASRREVAYQGPLILIDAITSNPGAGGGAVVNVNGELVGMIGKVIESNDTNTRLNYAVPQENLFAFLQGLQSTQIATTPKPGNADLGLRLFRLDGNKSPAYIDRVTRGGPAATAGLMPDDLIISINGETVANVGEYNEILDTLVAEQEVVIVVKRRKDLVRLMITPQKKD